MVRKRATLMLVSMALTLILFSALTVAIVWGLMWCAARWLHLYVALAIGLLAIVYFVQNIVRGIIHCAQPGVWVPPENGSGGEGFMIHNCDSAGGVIDRVYLYVTGPACVVALMLLVRRFWTAQPVTGSRP